MKCSCGSVILPGELFCQECGAKAPRSEEIAPKSYASEDEALPAGSGPNTAIGKNSILSNSQINTTNTTVNNTTIEDDTKKSIVCAVSGKRVLYIESVCCKGCNKDVSAEYYNELTRRCENCRQDDLQQYRVAFDAAMSGNGVDRFERSSLDLLANKLHLSAAEKIQIEEEIKAQFTTQAGEDFSELDDLFELDFMDAKKEILKKNDLSSALLKLKQIYDQVQTNDEVSCYYFLIKALKNPAVYIANFEAKSFEDYWENYWYFLAQLANGDKDRKGYNNFKQNHTKHSNRKDEIILSEVVYFLVIYQSSQNDGYISKANDKLLEIENISSGLLTKLFKTTHQLLTNFDYVDQRFLKLDAPDEPGLREYFIFFINQLYKISPATPAYVAAPVNTNLVTSTDQLGVTTKNSTGQSSVGISTPSVPNIPASAKPKIPGLAMPGKSEKSTPPIVTPSAPNQLVSPNKMPGLPPSPAGAGGVQKPAIPVPVPGKSNASLPNIPGKPAIPIPGKKP
jgi:hypothetical protein